MNAFAHHFSYEFKTGLRDRSLMLMIYLFPLFFYAMMGAIMTKINPFFKDAIAPAMIIFAGMTATLLGLPAPMVAARENGVLRSFWINGVPSINLLVIPALSVFMHLIVVCIIITASVNPLFQGGLPTNWSAFAGISVLSILVLACVGLLIGTVSYNNRMSMLLAQCIYIPSMMIGGLMMPVDMLPGGFKRLALLMPATHAMNALKGYAMGLPATFPPFISVATLIASGALALCASYMLFTWDCRIERRRSQWLALIAVSPFVVSAIVVK